MFKWIKDLLDKLFGKKPKDSFPYKLPHKLNK